MTHEDAGHYAAKHPPGTKLDSRIAEMVKQKISDGKITCTAAHKIAGELNVSPAEVGVVIDLLEKRISKCQLGLYGYGPQRKIVRPADSVSLQLKKAIEESLVNNLLSCFSSWEIAKRFAISKTDVCAACETFKIKISSCQLGAF